MARLAGRGLARVQGYIGRERVFVPSIFVIREEPGLCRRVRAAVYGRHPYGSLGLLNMASDQRPGGGVLRGLRAQEEDVCRRTSLYPSLIPHKYPLGPDELIASKDVVVVKDRMYRPLAPHDAPGCRSPGAAAGCSSLPPSLALISQPIRAYSGGSGAFARRLSKPLLSLLARSPSARISQKGEQHGEEKRLWHRGRMIFRSTVAAHENQHAVRRVQHALGRDEALVFILGLVVRPR